MVENALWNRMSHAKNPLRHFEEYKGFNFIHGHTITYKFTNTFIWRGYPDKDIKLKPLTVYRKDYENTYACCIDTGAKILNQSKQCFLTAFRLEDEKSFSVNPYKVTTNNKKIEEGVYYYLPKKKNYSDFDYSVFLEDKKIIAFSAN